MACLTAYGAALQPVESAPVRVGENAMGKPHSRQRTFLKAVLFFTAGGHPGSHLDLNTRNHWPLAAQVARRCACPASLSIALGPTDGGLAPKTIGGWLSLLHLFAVPLTVVPSPAPFHTLLAFCSAMV